jgi:hypothetical protein
MVGTAVFLYTIVAFGVRSSSFFGTIEKAPFCFLVPEILHLECIPQAGQPGVGVPGTGVFLGDFRGSTPLANNLAFSCSFNSTSEFRIWKKTAFVITYKLLIFENKSNGRQ